MLIPQISIIVPIYNSADTIKACVNSIKAQTFDNWELILVDNGSTDNSLQLVKTIAISDSRIVVVEVPKKGVANARNAGLDVVKGQYICFVDSDDTIDPTFLEELYLEGKYDLTMCGYYVDSYDADGNLISSNKNIPTKIDWSNKESKDVLVSIFKNGYFHFCWNKLFRRSIIETYNLRFRQIPVNEDFSFVMDYILYAQSIYIIDKPLYHWRHIIGKTSGVDSIPKNLLKIYNDSHEQLRLFFEDKSIADVIAYCSYELIIYKYYHAYKIEQLSNVELKKRLSDFHRNNLIKQSYKSHQPATLGERLLHTLAKNGWFKIHYLITQRKFL